MYISTTYCKKFTSVASQFCSLAGMDINTNISVDLSQLQYSILNEISPNFEEFWSTGLLSVTPELYDESCRDIVRNVASLEPYFQQFAAIVNIMCKNRDSSEDDDNNLAIELGVGLGVGIPAVGILVYFIVKRSKKEETTESIEPFLT